MNNKISELQLVKDSHILQDLAGRDEKIDKHVGNRLRERRVHMNQSQSAIANRIGITYQQIQKYESGVNRISAGRLYIMANILDVETNYFFEGLDYIITNEKTNLQELHCAADDIVDDKLRDAIMGIIDVAKKKPNKL